MYLKIFEELARLNNSTVEEVYSEMQKAISLSNPDVANMSVEEFITFCSQKIIDNNNFN